MPPSLPPFLTIQTPIQKRKYHSQETIIYMASLQASGCSLFSSSSSSSKRINNALSVPKLPKIRVRAPKMPIGNLVDELSLRDGFTVKVPIEKNVTLTDDKQSSSSAYMEMLQFYAILEAVADRVEMHNNMSEQRDNWNNLLLNSINMITLGAATMAGVAAVAGDGGAAAASILGLKLSSTLLFSAATGMLMVMNKIQPSQLVEEQRNATRLFRQLQRRIETSLALGAVTKEDVKDVMERVLALDKAYPLPLIGTMLEKFPEKLDPAIWWPKSETKTKTQRQNQDRRPWRKTERINGWNEELEMEMREVVEVMKIKDIEDYERLGNIALKLNKALAISGPVLTGTAALGSAFIGSSNVSWAPVAAMAGAALATIVNTLEHGCQVGMVFEMYRNNAGFFTNMEETIASTIDETDAERRENGDLFEMKVALQLGRSLSQLKDLARKSSSSRLEGVAIDEFASKLF